MDSSLALIACETSEALLVGGQVVFLGDLHISTRLSISLAQNEWKNLEMALNFK